MSKNRAGLLHLVELIVRRWCRAPRHFPVPCLEEFKDPARLPCWRCPREKVNWCAPGRCVACNTFLVRDALEAVLLEKFRSERGQSWSTAVRCRQEQ